MCFSAHASFIAAAGLSLAGLASIYRTSGRPSIRPLATIPLLFGIQQACEGIVWLGLEGKAFVEYTHIAASAFLFFALILWPVYIPYMLYKLEHHLNKRRLLLIPFLSGVTVALVHGYFMLTKPLVAQVSCNHIAYSYNMPHSTVLMLLYALATVLPFFLVHSFLLRITGVLGALSALIAHIFYVYNFGSVWCFFAALLSFFILFIINADDLRKIDSTHV